jgi:hypothetical protein
MNALRARVARLEAERHAVDRCDTCAGLREIVGGSPADIAAAGAHRRHTLEQLVVESYSEHQRSRMGWSQ